MLKSSKILSLLLVSPILLTGCTNNIKHADPYQVYSDLLHEATAASAMKPERFVVRAETSQIGKESSVRSDLNLDAVSPSAVEDFIAKNSQGRTSLENNFAQNLNVHLLTNEKLKSIFNNEVKDGWKEFYEIFPDSTGFIQFSQVGFSADGTQAIVMVASSSGPLAGGGSFVVLNWNGKRWETQQRVTLFKS